MTAPIDIRFATANDAVAIAALATQVFLDTYAAQGVRPDLAREVFQVCSLDAFRARLEQPERGFVLAMRGDGLVGFAEVMRQPLAAPAGGVRGAELAKLYVQPNAQREGIGRMLLKEAEQAALLASLDRLWLTAWDRNDRALAFYARMGYEDIGSSIYTFEGRDYGNRVLARLLHP